MFRNAIPVLHVSRSALAEDFYGRQLGFRRRFAHGAGEGKPDPCYLGLMRDRMARQVSSFSGDGVSGAAPNVLVDDVDALPAELVARGVRIDTGPVDQSWRTREMNVMDAYGNSIRIVQPGAATSKKLPADRIRREGRGRLSIPFAGKGTRTVD